MHRLLPFVLLAVVSIPFARASNFIVPECISGLCLRGNLNSLPTEQQVKKLIGSSRQATSSVPHRKSSCHLITTPKHKKVYAKFSFINVEPKWRLITITVASQKLCDNPEPLWIDFDLLTENKIGLGSQQEGIIDVYGEPKYLLGSPSKDLLASYFPNSSNQIADTVIQYVSEGDSLLTTRFFLSKGVVIGIDLSADE